MLHFDKHRTAERDSVLLSLENTTEELIRTPVDVFLEENRQVPAKNSALPGLFSLAPTEYFREPLNCLSPEDPTQFIAIRKGAQVGATMAYLEGFILYAAAQVKDKPILFYSATKDLAKIRMEENISPMFSDSGFSDIIQSNNELRIGKRGATETGVSWYGGGYLVPLGAVNANAMRSLSAPYLLRDEISGWPMLIGGAGSKQGCPIELTTTRTNGFSNDRKIIDISTPLIEGQCHITNQYMQGDQRQFEVPCKSCGRYQVLKFQGENPKTGEKYGLIYELDAPQRLTPGSVRYKCIHCGAEWIDEDKLQFIPAGRWKPTAKAKRAHTKSYHVSALYAPHFAKSWSSIVEDWLEAWDTERNRTLDPQKLQTFYNNCLGLAYRNKQDKLMLRHVSPHKRNYKSGEIPNDHAIQYAGGKIQVLTCSVDVQNDWLAVAVWGFAPSGDKLGYAKYLIEYKTMEGSTEKLEGDVWKELESFLFENVYEHNDDQFEIQMAFIDSGYRTETVYNFCSYFNEKYCTKMDSELCYPIRGRKTSAQGARYTEFSPQTTEQGVDYFQITVDSYKDRFAAVLKNEWDGLGLMPRNQFSAPSDITKSQLAELTKEQREEIVDKQSGKIIGSRWVRPSGSRNELFDLMVYGTAAFEVLALDVCEKLIYPDDKDSNLVWPDFWDFCKENEPFIGVLQNN